MTAVLLLVGTGRGVGLGHERRMARLAIALQGAGADVETTKLSLDSVSGPQTADLSGSTHDCLIVDLPDSLWSTEIEASVSGVGQRGHLIVTVDRLIPASDVVIVPSFHVDTEIKAEAAAKGVDLLWGWEHVLLEPITSRPSERDVNHLLVITGGGDEAGVGALWPRMIDRVLPEDWAVTWVVGPFACEPVLPQTTRLRWDLLTGSTDLGSAMARASMALAVYGVSALELLAHAVPSVLYSPYGPRDVGHLELLDRSGLALVAHDASEAVDTLARLAVESHTAEGLAHNCALLEIRGTQATASRLFSLCNRDGSSVGA